MTNGSRRMGKSKPSLGFPTNGLTARTNLTTRVSHHTGVGIQLKNEFTLTPKEYNECKRVFQEWGLVGVLQQSGCYSISPNSQENEIVLHQA